MELSRKDDWEYKSVPDVGLHEVKHDFEIYKAHALVEL
jgi:hypothetical protein